MNYYEQKEQKEQEIARLISTGWQAMCGWCGQWDELARLPIREAFTGNRWGIHQECYMDWYDEDDSRRPK